MEGNIRKTETKRILIYIGITFLLTYGYCFGVIYPLINRENSAGSGSTQSILSILVAVVMFFPAIGVLLTRLITKEGFKNVWIKPHFKGNIRTYLLAYFGPGILTILGALVYFLVYPDNFDKSFGYLGQTLAGTGVQIPQESLPIVLISQTVTAFLFGPIMNIVTCFGEEWGWRGYLLPKMAEKLPPVLMLLVNGVIWGLWHAPLTAVGHNYGVGYKGFPFAGIAAMCGFCIVMGTFFSYVAMKTKSCIPAVLAHGAINSIASIGIYMTKDGGNPFIGPAPTGIVGASPFILVAIVLMIVYFRKKGNDRVDESITGEPV